MATRAQAPARNHRGGVPRHDAWVEQSTHGVIDRADAERDDILAAIQRRPFTRTAGCSACGSGTASHRGPDADRSAAAPGVDQGHLSGTL